MLTCAVSVCQTGAHTRARDQKGGGNAAGIMLVVNNLWQLSNAKHGLPVAFVVRGTYRVRVSYVARVWPTVQRNSAVVVVVGQLVLLD